MSEEIPIETTTESTDQELPVEYISSVIQNKEIREKSRLLYLGGYTVEEIVKIMNVHPDDLNKLIYGLDGSAKSRQCWAYLRSQMPATAITAYLAEKAHILDRTTGIAVSLLSKNLEKLLEIANDPMSPACTPADLAMIASVVMNMDKITRLETGKATQIVKQMGLSPEEARQILEEDPMAKCVEAEYYEIMNSLKE